MDDEHKLDNNAILNELPYIPAEFVALDLKTTGLYAGHDRIVSIGAVKVDMTTGALTKYQALVNPEIELTEYQETLNDITNNMLSGKQPLDVELPKLLEFIGTLPIVCHNAEFDISFLKHECGVRQIKFPNIAYCSLTLSREAYKLTYYSLQNVAEHLDIEIGPSSDALSDAMTAATIFIHAAEKLGWKHLRNTNKYTSSIKKPADESFKYTYTDTSNSERKFIVWAVGIVIVILTITYVIQVT